MSFGNGRLLLCICFEERLWERKGSYSNTQGKAWTIKPLCFCPLNPPETTPIFIDPTPYPLNLFILIKQFHSIPFQIIYFLIPYTLLLVYASPTTKMGHPEK